jgi:hypothetical protein
VAYQDREDSAYQGEPVELYQFGLGSRVWRYTSGDAYLEWDGEGWLMAAIRRGAIELTREIARSALRLEVERDFPPALLLREVPPDLELRLQIRRLHRGDEEAVVVWTGRVVGAEWAGSICTLSCDTEWTTIRRQGLRRTFGRACPHLLYGPSCGLERAEWVQMATLSAVDAVTLTSAAFGLVTDGRWVGGYLEWDSPEGVPVRRFVTGHQGDEIVVAYPVAGLAAGATVALYPGCKHTIIDCAATFGNAANYGGWLWVPATNPMGGAGVI